MRPQLAIQGTNVVLRGQFNPAMFHPAWLAAHDLIRDQEADAAEVKIIHPEAAVFDVEWLQVRVTRDRFQAASVQEAYYEALRDLVLGTFTILDQTPLRVMGVNRDFHYQLGSEEAWHTVGDRLAPKEDWSGLLKEPGLKSLTMQGRRPDSYCGYIGVKVQPSSRVDLGIYIEVNDHYQLTSDSNTPAGKSDVFTILSEDWQDSMKRGVDIATRLTGLGDLEA